jgi:GxxExxY protein
MNENEIGKIVVDCATTKAHKKQVLTYLKLTNLKLGFLLNFGEALMKDGITRLINGTIQ